MVSETSVALLRHAKERKNGEFYSTSALLHESQVDDCLQRSSQGIIAECIHKKNNEIQQIFFIQIFPLTVFFLRIEITFLLSMTI